MPTQPQDDVLVWEGQSGLMGEKFNENMNKQNMKDGVHVNVAGFAAQESSARSKPLAGFLSPLTHPVHP
jgi:hypothetical protein